jgi:hypothetical protein
VVIFGNQEVSARKEVWETLSFRIRHS